MNVAEKLEALGLKGWTIREDHVTDDPTILNRIEWAISRPVLTWEQLQTVVVEKPIIENIETVKLIAFDGKEYTLSLQSFKNLLGV